jgi:crossover junction endodeoxyribonuclease RuvC
MIILGVDPGSIKTGYGLVEVANSQVHHLTHDVLVLPKHKDIPDRLKLIYDHLSGIIEVHKPDIISLETSFYGKNAQSALKLGQVRGAIIVLAKNYNVRLYEYSPREVKKIITGKGSAAKQHVANMIKSILKLQDLPLPFDASDALALAVSQALKIQSPSHELITSTPFKKKGNPNKRSESWSKYLHQNRHRIISG